MDKRIFAFCITVIFALLTGCATQRKMPDLSRAEAFKPDHDPIFLFTVTLRNDYKPRYQPELIVTHVEKPGADEKAERLNFRPDDLSEDETLDDDNGYRYFLRLQLPREEFVLVGFTAMGSGFPVHGIGVAPVLAPVPIEPSGVYYLGHIEAHVRKRVGEEFRAGPVIPLIDQAVTGFAGGTFDIVIEDRWSADEATFLSKYPGLKNVEIQKRLLPPFDRAKAQEWYDKL